MKEKMTLEQYFILKHALVRGGYHSLIGKMVFVAMGILMITIGIIATVKNINIGWLFIILGIIITGWFLTTAKQMKRNLRGCIEELYDLYSKGESFQEVAKRMELLP